MKNFRRSCESEYEVYEHRCLRWSFLAGKLQQSVKTNRLLQFPLGEGYHEMKMMAKPCLFTFLMRSAMTQKSFREGSIEGGGEAVLILMIEEHLSIHFFAPSQWRLMTSLFISLTRANFSPDTTQSSQKTRHDTWRFSFAAGVFYFF